MYIVRYSKASWNTFVKIRPWDVAGHMMEEDTIISSNDVIPFPRGLGNTIPNPQKGCCIMTIMIIVLTKEEKTFEKGGHQEESSVTRNL